MRRAAAWFVLAPLLALACLTACEKVTSVASSVSPCFRILPEAHAAVGGQGEFVDVKRVERSALPSFRLRRRTTTTTIPAVTQTTIVPRADVCLVAYQGTFKPALITNLLDPHRTGKYAVVIVSVRTQVVRGVFLTNILPKPLQAH